MEVHEAGEAIIRELDDLAHSNNVLKADALALPNLRGDGPLDDAFERIRTATEQLPVPKSDAAWHLLGEPEGRWSKNFTERRHVAARQMGTSAARLRKKIDGVSPYDELLAEVAALISGAGTTEAPAAERGAGRRRRFVPAFAAVGALLLVLALVAVTFNDAEPDDATRLSDADLSDDAESSTEPGIGDGGDDATDEPEGAQTPDVAVAVELEARPCPFAVGEPAVVEAGADAREAAFLDLFEQNGGSEALGCAVERVTERGGVFWQELRLHGKARGGLLATSAGEAMYLNAGQWRSYIRVGGGDGTLSPTWAGEPTGEVSETEDGWLFAVTGDVEMVAEALDGSYFWLPGIVVRRWDDAGRSAGIHGRPASSPYRQPNGIRQDFEHGYFLLTPAGDLTWTEVADPGAELPPPEELRGRIISANDGTGWLIDDELRRWWIVDAEHWYCAGADKNQVDPIVSGSAIAALEYGGLLDCPALLSGVQPRGGTTSRKVYCESQVQDRAADTPYEDGFACTDGANFVPIDLQELCAWQYGEEATAHFSAGDSSNWRCESG